PRASSVGPVDPAVARAADAQRLAVLGDRAPGDVEAVLLLEDLDDGLVRERLVAVLAGDDRAHELAHAGARGRVLAGRRATVRRGPGRHLAGEEHLHGHDAARRLHVLAADGAADRRDVHAERVGD